MTIDWDLHKTDVLRIAGEEVGKSTYGYLQRAVERIATETPISPSTDALSSFLRNRAGDAWDQILQQVENGETAISVEIVEVEALPADHPDLRRLERQFEAAKSDLRAEQRRRKEADEQASVAEAVRSAIRTSVAPWEPKVPQPVSTPSDDAEPVDMVLVLSDEHADHEIHPDQTLGIERYNFDVFRARGQRLVEVIEGFVRHHLPRYDFERLLILKLGDSIQGDIHDMKLRNSLGNSVRAALATGDVEAQMVERFLATFPRVDVLSVPGNHPRTTKIPQNEDPHDNLDFAVAATMRQRLAGYVDEGRVTVHAPRSWAAFVNVRGWDCFLSHGDEVRSYRGFPWYGFDRRDGRVKAMAQRAAELNHGISPRIDYMFHGHFHTPTKRSHAGSRSFHNGAWYETDPYTTKQLAVGNIPEQTALVFRDRRGNQGHIFEIPIYLRDSEREAALEAGEWEPELGRSTVLDEVTS